MCRADPGGFWGKKCTIFLGDGKMNGREVGCVVLGERRRIAGAKAPVWALYGEMCVLRRYGSRYFLPQAPSAQQLAWRESGVFGCLRMYGTLLAIKRL